MTPPSKWRKKRAAGKSAKRAEKDQTIQVANARAIAIEGQNEAQIKIAESAAKLQVKQAEAKKLAEVAQKVQEAKTLEEAYQAEKRSGIKARGTRTRHAGSQHPGNGPH